MKEMPKAVAGRRNQLKREVDELTKEVWLIEQQIKKEQDYYKLEKLRDNRRTKKSSITAKQKAIKKIDVEYSGQTELF